MYSPSPEPTRKLKSDYKIEKFDEYLNKVISTDLNFEITIPNDWEVSIGGGFDPIKPKDEYVSVEFFPPKKVANLILAVRIGEIESDDIKTLIERGIKTIQGHVTKQISKNNIGNTTGYDFYWESNEGAKVYEYYTQDRKNYVNIGYFYPFSGIEETHREKAEVEKVISSFRLLTK